ncbi:DNA polymerase eta-like isoform X2 [Palaemon carinicauda]
MTDRLVVLLDMDCFYVQVEERHYPHIKGLPAAVVQYNAWKGGGIIAVNYEARAFGVKRGMRGDEARSKCPDIQLVTVPVNRGKADLTRYRDAGKEVINVLCDYSDCVERASIDEAYIDFTSAVLERIGKQGGMINPESLKSTWVVGYDEVTSEISNEEKEETRKNGVKEWLSSFFVDEDDLPLDNTHPKWDNIRLAHTAVLCEEMRAAVLERTGFKCSAGIAHNKMLGKLSCGLHKPNQQTILPHCSVESLWKNMPVGKVRNLGGKLGDSLTDELGCKTMGDLAQLSLQQLNGRFDNKTSEWLYNLGRGIDTESVTSRQLPKSIGCGKNFQGKEALNTQDKVNKWMLSLAEELTERLTEDQNVNKRRAKTLTVSVRLDGDARFTTLSRSANLPAYCTERITRVALSLIQPTNKASPKSGLWTPSIKNISLSAGKFEDWTGSGSGDIQAMFKKARENPRTSAKSVDCEEKSNNNQVSSGLPSPVKDAVTYPLKTLQSNLGKSEKVGSSQKVNKRKSGNLKNSPIASNSFFKNLLQRRINQQSTVATDSVSSSSENHTAVELQGENNDIHQIENESDDKQDNGDAPFHEVVNESNDENEEKSDLDMLVSFLSDEDVESEDDLTCGQNSKVEVDSDSSVYDAATDIDSSFSSECIERLQQSQDLFEEADPVLKTATKLSGKDVLCHIPASSISVSPEKMSSLKSCNNSLNNHDSKNKLGNEKVSVEELFPDLDNVDESVLSLLPKELQIEVETALKDYKEKKQKKAGMWKYVTSIPSPQKCGNSSVNFSSIADAKPGPSRDGISESSIRENSESMKSLEINNTDSGEKNFINCEQCGIRTSVFEMQEHADYHLALSLQSTLKKDANVTKQKIERTFKSNRGKRKIKGNAKSPVTDGKMKKLDSFFKT